MDALRTVTQVPVKAALDTHYHFDHSTGNSFYGANNIPVWAHAAAGRRIVDSYSPMLGAEKSAVLAPLGVTALSNIFDDLAAQAEKMHKAGPSADDAANQYVIPDSLKKFPAPVWGFTIGAAIKKLYAEQQHK
jgi:hypothetical protein